MSSLRPQRWSLAALLLLGSSAWPGPPKLLLVAPKPLEGVPAEAEGRAAKLLAARLSHLEGVELVAWRGTAGFVETGQRALERGRAAEAAEAFRLALLALRLDAADADAALVTDAHLGRAAALLRLGESRAADETLRSIAALASTVELKQALAPSLRRALSRAQERLGDRKRGQLAVDGPPGARVIVDDVMRGPVPQLLTGLLPGRHLVVVEGAGGQRFGQLVELRVGLTKVHAEFEAEGATIDTLALRRIGALATGANADYVLFGVLAPGPGTLISAGLALFARSWQACVLLEPLDLPEAEAVDAPHGRTIADEVRGHISAFGPAVALPVTLVPPRPMALPPPTPAPANPPPPAVLDASPIPEVPTVAPAGDRPVWLYVLAGVAVAAGLGAGAYFTATALTRRTTGTVSVTW